jgi:hypothetical protein
MAPRIISFASAMAYDIAQAGLGWTPSREGQIAMAGLLVIWGGVPALALTTPLTHGG